MPPTVPAVAPRTSTTSDAETKDGAKINNIIMMKMTDLVYLSIIPPKGTLHGV